MIIVLLLLLLLMQAGALLVDLQDWYKSTNNIDPMVQELFSANNQQIDNLYRDDNYWLLVNIYSNASHILIFSSLFRMHSFFCERFSDTCCGRSRSNRHGSSPSLISSGQTLGRFPGHGRATAHNAQLFRIYYMPQENTR